MGAASAKWTDALVHLKLQACSRAFAKADGFPLLRYLKVHLSDSSSMLDTKLLYSSRAAVAPSPAASLVLTVPTFGYRTNTTSARAEHAGCTGLRVDDIISVTGRSWPSATYLCVDASSLMRCHACTAQTLCRTVPNRVRKSSGRFRAGQEVVGFLCRLRFQDEPVQI